MTKRTLPMSYRTLLLAMLLPVTAGAATITVDAARLDVDRKADLATFSGNVVVKRDDMTLTSDKLTGNLADKGLQSLTATGNVTITRGSGAAAETATGDKAVYTPSSGKLVLTGQRVTLTHKGNTLTGTRLDYDVKAGKASITGQGSVHGTLVGE